MYAERSTFRFEHIDAESLNTKRAFAMLQPEVLVSLPLRMLCSQMVGTAYTAGCWITGSYWCIASPVVLIGCQIPKK